MEAPPITHTMGLAISRSPYVKKRRIARYFLAAIFFAFALLFVLQFAAPQDSNAQTTPLPVSSTSEAMQNTAAASSVFADQKLIAQSAYVYDVKENVVLYDHNGSAQLPLASLTKVALMLVVADVLPYDEPVVVPSGPLTGEDPTHFVAGDVWRARDLMDYTLAASSNDGAEILAAAANAHVLAHNSEAPENGATLWAMNQLSRTLDLPHIYFLNVSGLDISTTQSGAYGSAEDVAKLFAYAAQTHAELFAATTKDGMVYTSRKGTQITAHNTDKALDSFPHMIMGKTGYTDLVGGNLAIVFNVEPDHPIVAVVMGSTIDGRFNDMKTLVATIVKLYSSKTSV